MPATTVGGMPTTETIVRTLASYSISVPQIVTTPAKSRSGDLKRLSFLQSVDDRARFAHRRDPLTRLDLVFMDTTSLYFEGAGGQTLGQHGYSKDHRPDLRQMILAVLIDGDGRPGCSEMWPANTADGTKLSPEIDRLRRRSSIARGG